LGWTAVAHTDDLPEIVDVIGRAEISTQRSEIGNRTVLPTERVKTGRRGSRVPTICPKSLIAATAWKLNGLPPSEPSSVMRVTICASCGALAGESRSGSVGVSVS
jgi:hypothetical protein